MKKMFFALLAVSFVTGLFFSGPADAQQKAMKWKIQSGAPAADFRYANIADLAARINEMAGGRLELETFGAGAIVPTFEILDAVSKGLIDGGHTSPNWWTGKNSAASLYGGVPCGPYGMSRDDFASWIYIGGGLELYNEMLQKELKYDVVSFPAITDNPDALGWWKKPIKSVAELKGLKFRTSGMSGEVFNELGAAVVTVPPGEIVPALERGVIDGAELSGPCNDIAMGFHTVRKVYILGSLQQTSGYMEVIFNKKKFDALPADLKAIVRSGCMAETFHSTLKQAQQNMVDLETLVKKHGVTVERVPEDINREIIKAWDRLAEKKSKESPFFAKMLASQKAWAERSVSYRQVADPPIEMAVEHYWKGANYYKK
ncbi:MAG: TRAP transporter substrate-binding protein [Desulfobacterales bacterium]|nr:TRAP transporter substrate-binding protein [Desulfobacterales bacterium]